VDEIKVGAHVFLVVLVFGTGWRLATYHLMASRNPHLQHLGSAMAIQY
jgi:hypothetical protein